MCMGNIFLNFLFALRFNKLMYKIGAISKKGKRNVRNFYLSSSLFYIALTLLVLMLIRSYLSMIFSAFAGGMILFILFLVLQPSLWNMVPSNVIDYVNINRKYFLNKDFVSKLLVHAYIIENEKPYCDSSMKSYIIDLKKEFNI